MKVEIFIKNIHLLYKVLCDFSEFNLAVAESTEIESNGDINS